MILRSSEDHAKFVRHLTTSTSNLATSLDSGGNGLDEKFIASQPERVFP